MLLTTLLAFTSLHNLALVQAAPSTLKPRDAASNGARSIFFGGHRPDSTIKLMGPLEPGISRRSPQDTETGAESPSRLSSSNDEVRLSNGVLRSFGKTCASTGVTFYYTTAGVLTRATTIKAIRDELLPLSTSPDQGRAQYLQALQLGLTDTITGYTSTITQVFANLQPQSSNAPFYSVLGPSHTFGTDWVLAMLGISSTSPYVSYALNSTTATVDYSSINDDDIITATATLLFVGNAVALIQEYISSPTSALTINEALVLWLAIGSLHDLFDLAVATAIPDAGGNAPYELLAPANAEAVQNSIWALELGYLASDDVEGFLPPRVMQGKIDDANVPSGC